MTTTEQLLRKASDRLQQASNFIQAALYTEMQSDDEDIIRTARQYATMVQADLLIVIQRIRTRGV